MSNQFSKSLYSSNDQIRLNHTVIKILSNPYILAHIMKYCAREFEGMEIEDIVPCIDDLQNHVSSEPGDQTIYGLNTVDAVPNEGVVTFDILFTATTTSKDPIKVYINVEPQNTYYTGYDLTTRGVFYCARLLSKQYGIEFTGKNYNDIKKVYSIWLITNPPKHSQNSILSYRLQPHHHHGHSKISNHYDLLEIIMVQLGKENTDIVLNRLLEVLLSTILSPSKKEEILSEEFRIPMTSEMKEGVQTMCNYSEGILQKGIEQGIEQGKAEMRLNDIQSLLNHFPSKSLEEVMDMLSIPKSKQKQYKELLEEQNAKE